MNVNINLYFQYVPLNLFRNYLDHIIVCSVFVVRSHYSKGCITIFYLNQIYRFWAVRWLCIPYCSGIRVLFLIIKPTRCTNFSNLLLEGNSTCFRQFLCSSSGVFYCTHSNGICHTGLLTAARKLSANLYDIYHCCVYSEKLLMMDRGTV